jgi:hypothetical protein
MNLSSAVNVKSLENRIGKIARAKYVLNTFSIFIHVTCVFHGQYWTNGQNHRHSSSQRHETNTCCGVHWEVNNNTWAIRKISAWGYCCVAFFQP